MPHTGLLAFVRGEFELNDVGSDVIFVTHHPDKSLLNADAFENMKFIFVVDEVSQLEISWLNTKQLSNIPVLAATPPTFVADARFQAVISELNTLQPRNIDEKLLPLLTSHVDTFPLKLLHD